MRRVAADYIFPVSGPPLKNGIIEFDDNGNILSLTDTQGRLTESSGLEYYNGVLVPGFILPCFRIEQFIFRTKISDFAGLRRFINNDLESVIPNPETDNRFHDLDMKLHKSGIRGIGCITNRFHFFRNKSKGSINYHSFIEIPPGEKTEAYEFFNKAVEDIMTAWNEFRLPSSIIPFNCCPEEIMEHIANFSVTHENPLLLGCRGNTPYSILDNFSTLLSRITGREKDQAMWDFRNPVIIISDDLSELPGTLNNRTFLLYPPENKYIIEKMSDRKESWNRFSGNILFSGQLFDYNPEVPVIDELKFIQAQNPWLSFQDIIRCFTLNPACALCMDQHSGSLIPGKKPGLNLITNFNFTDFKLQDSSEIRHLI
jgi:hypothetical protein